MSGRLSSLPKPACADERSDATVLTAADCARLNQRSARTFMRAKGNPKSCLRRLPIRNGRSEYQSACARDIRSTQAGLPAPRSCLPSHPE